MRQLRRKFYLVVCRSIFFLGLIFFIVAALFITAGSQGLCYSEYDAIHVVRSPNGKKSAYLDGKLCQYGLSAVGPISENFWITLQNGWFHSAKISYEGKIEDISWIDDHNLEITGIYHENERYGDVNVRFIIPGNDAEK